MPFLWVHTTKTLLDFNVSRTGRPNSYSVPKNLTMQAISSKNCTGCQSASGFNIRSCYTSLNVSMDLHLSTFHLFCPYTAQSVRVYVLLLTPLALLNTKFTVAHSYLHLKRHFTSWLHHYGTNCQPPSAHPHQSPCLRSVSNFTCLTIDFCIYLVSFVLFSCMLFATKCAVIL